MNEDLQNQIDELHQIIDDQRRLINDIKGEYDEKLSEMDFIISEHKHTGADNTSRINGDIVLKKSSFLTIGNSQLSEVSSNIGATNEANRQIFLAGPDTGPGYKKTTPNSQIQIEHQPGTNGSTNQTFYYGFRPPLYSQPSPISITSGGSTLTDTEFQWTTNELAGAYIDVYDSTGAFKETATIASNTATVITINETWGFTDSSSTYVVFMPIYLGSADYPWRRLYFAEDIRIGTGTSSGTGVCYIKHGTGTPEGAVTAQVGSLYLRRDGGSSTTLYVKESGAGNTGWVAK